MSTVETELSSEFPEHSIFFIGRDFTQAYVYGKARGILNPDQLFTANISRRIRDAANAGNMGALQKLLNQSGLTKEQALKHGVVLVDSSMNGKISAVILKALTLEMEPKESYQLLSNSYVRYIKSGRKDGAGIADAAKAAGAGSGKLSRQQVDSLLARIQGITEFKITIPEGYEDERTTPHRLFEHNPKFLSSAKEFNDEESDTVLSSEEPKSPGARIYSLLGLQSDLVLHNEASNSETFKDIDAAAAGGRDSLAKWQDVVDPSTTAEFAKMKVVATGDEELPFELTFDGKVIHRMKARLSEGNNIEAYLTDRGEVLKVLKQAKNARKQILQAWAKRVMSEYGIKTAPVHSIEPHGLWLTMEYAPSDSLEYTYGFDDTPLPKKLKQQILAEHEKAKKLAAEKDIWLDQKAANYHLDSNGSIVNVDFTPRLNSSYYRFFRNDAGREFTDDEFLDMFLHYDARKGIAKKLPKPESARAKCVTKAVSESIRESSASKNQP